MASITFQKLQELLAVPPQQQKLRVKFFAFIADEIFDINSEGSIRLLIVPSLYAHLFKEIPQVTPEEYDLVYFELTERFNRIITNGETQESELN